MKNLFLQTFLIVFFQCAFSQSSKLSATLSYPYPFDSNFVGRNYTGVVDLGVQYRFVEIAPVAVGGSLNASYLVFSDHPSPQLEKINATFIQPRIFGELHMPGLRDFRPSLGVGYSFTNFKGKGAGGAEDVQENLSGINLNLGFYFDVTDRFFTHLHYDFIKVNSPDSVPNVKENTNINQLKIGIGLSI